jgi:hypothetical protein
MKCEIFESGIFELKPHIIIRNNQYCHHCCDINAKSVLVNNFFTIFVYVLFITEICMSIDSKNWPELGCFNMKLSVLICIK